MQVTAKVRSLRERFVSHRAAPWCALLGAWLLFELPSGIRNSSFQVSALRPSADFLALVTLYQVGRSVGYARTARVLTWFSASVLVLYRVDVAIFAAILSEDPLLYDQLFILRHTLVLISDLWSLTTLAILSGTLLAVLGGLWVARALLRAARPLFEGESRHTTARAGYIAWLLALVLSTNHVWGVGKKPFVRWDAPALADNLVRSRATYRSVQRGLAKSPYRSLDKVRLSRKPDVLLLVVESYGRLAFDHQEMAASHRAVTDELTSKLTAAGYDIASAYTRAPVRGGRSWLAQASLVLGAEVRYEAVFAQVISRLSRVRHLVSFFATQGYETVSLAPADRVRPGVVMTNRYGFDRVVAYKELGYRGPVMGWGIIPDQYSLEHTNEHVLARATRPMLLIFSMVSSHAPWAVVPKLVPDYRELGVGSEVPVVLSKKSSEQSVVANLRHFERRARRGNYRKLAALTRDGYLASVRYDLELITRFAEQDKRDRLYVVVGDHQPPLLGTDKAGYDTPMHVFARDPKLLAEFRTQGFVDGLTLPAKQKAALSHAGFLSLLTRALARCCGDVSHMPLFRKAGYNLLKR